MPKLPYTKSGVNQLKVGFLARPTRMSGPSQIVLHRLLRDLRQHVLCAYLVSNTKCMLKFQKQKKRS